MTLAASSRSGIGASKRWTSSLHVAAAWVYIASTFAALVAFLALTPDGIVEPAQTLAGWLVGGGVAALAVGTVVRGLERLLDCETD
ncbi:hypothetical protein [Polaromonas sp.]|uniref:hypothetical protein n=1 Tax=Polaromonas sp. TaxID=1869339 RepID=UPI0037509F2F